ncbi:MAG: hypothetical protein IT368_04875 [Candidatus Hydrogenedentes bacterium]|nr:hypothetical protein [Candidatus Hydrogenedentota bacterium]
MKIDRPQPNEDITVREENPLGLGRKLVRPALGCAGILIMGVIGVAALDNVIDPFDDDMHITYPNYETMDADGAVIRGWVPKFVPWEAVDFEEAHNLDTNRSWLRFSAPPEALERMTRSLVPVTVSDVDFPRKPPRSSGNWWPRALTESLWVKILAGKSKRDDYEFYRYDYESHAGGIPRPKRDFVAIDRATGTVWHWRP